MKCVNAYVSSENEVLFPVCQILSDEEVFCQHELYSFYFYTESYKNVSSCV